MKFAFRHWCLVAGLATALIALVAFPLSASPLSARAGQQDASFEPVAANAYPAAASLHNGYFDNHIWYEFNRRYQSAYPAGVWLPAGNTYGDTQDWRLWFLDGTDLVDAEATTANFHSAPESLKMWSIDTSAHIVTGIYQEVNGVVPCLTYQFQMYGYSRPLEAGDSLAAMKVGIDKTGWHPDSKNDPAVHSWPSTMVWGTSQLYTSDFGSLVVTAEALGTKIAVFTYVDAYGGSSHRTHWDTGSLQEGVTNLVPDPDNPGTPNGITSGPTATGIGSTSATIGWATANPGVGQVFYRPLASPNPITFTHAYTVYLPLVVKQGSSWYSAWDKTSTTSHTVGLSGLRPDTTYEYFVVSRGLSGGACTNWLSSKYQFSTLP